MNENLIPLYIKNFSEMLDDGLLVTDKNGKVLLSNLSAQEFLGKDPININIYTLLNINELKNLIKSDTDGELKNEFYYQTDDELKRSLVIKIKKTEENLFTILLLDMTLQRNLEKVRRDFVANVSHELRSPLTSLVGFIETLLSGDVHEETTRLKFLKIMDEEAKRMNRLIDDILSLSKVETEEHISPTTSISIIDPIKSVMAAIAERGLDKKNKVVLKDMRFKTNKPSYIIGNFDEINQVFMNLIENAIKYGYEDTEIILKLDQINHDELLVKIINQGEGIQQKYIDRLTERFFRIDKTRSRKIGGTGLGLAIVKHILIRHRASLTIKSEINKETIFSICFPLIKS